MNRMILRGVNGAGPLGFLSALGLLRVLTSEHRLARMGFLADGTFCPFLEGVDADVAQAVLDDAVRQGSEKAWWLEYGKEEKRGAKVVADLKAPPQVFSNFLSASVDRWVKGAGEAVAYAAAFGTSEARDGKGNTKPTAFHFTAANQQFLGTLEEIRASVTRDWAQRSLFTGYAGAPGANLRWDPAADRNWALMAENPTRDGTSVDAPLEWLAFRALALFPTFPCGTRIITTAVTGRGEDMRLRWPLWNQPVSLATVRSALQVDWSVLRDRGMRGVFAICTSSIRRTAQGFGNFSPATIET